MSLIFELKFDLNTFFLGGFESSGKFLLKISKGPYWLIGPYSTGSGSLSLWFYWIFKSGFLTWLNSSVLGYENYLGYSLTATVGAFDLFLAFFMPPSVSLNPSSMGYNSY